LNPSHLWSGSYLYECKLNLFILFDIMKGLVFGLYSLDYALVKNMDRIGFSWRSRFFKIFAKKVIILLQFLCKICFFRQGAKIVSLKRSSHSGVRFLS